MNNTSEEPAWLSAQRHELDFLEYIAFLGQVTTDAMDDIIEFVVKKNLLSSDLSAHDKIQEIGFTKPQSARVEPVKTDLLCSISETKAFFSEAIKSLDLLGNYLQKPGDKTAKRLKNSFYHQNVSHKEHYPPDKIQKFLNIFRINLIKKHPDYLDNEYKKHNSEQDTESMNKSLDYDLKVVSQPRSMSPDGNKFDSASNHNSNEDNFENKNIGHSESNDKVRITSVQKNEENDEQTFSFDELKQKPQTITTIAKNSKIGKKDKYNERLEHKTNEGSTLINKASLVISEKHEEDVGDDQEHSAKETLPSHEKIMKRKALKSRNSLMESVSEKNLLDENNFLKEELKLLKIKHKELLFDLGECGVREKAKEKKKRKSELFQRTKKDLVPEDKDENESHGNVSSGTMANLSYIETETPAVQSSSKEKTSSEEELMQSETGVNEASAMASMGKDRKHDDSLIEQNYETLPYSVQQDYSNAPEYITLKHIPPTSVAASLYNNYMFLLLSLAQNLLSSDVVKLKVWAAQRFSIDNPQNATDVLIKLDQEGFVHASDLSQLRDFFESILRIDLVCVIDAFLLGDYSLFRELSACKKLDVNRTQTQPNTVNSRYQNLMSSVHNPNGFSFKSLTNACSISPRNGEKGLPTSAGSRRKNYESRLPATHQAATSNSWNTSKPMLLSRSPGEDQTLKSGELNNHASGSGPSAKVTNTVVADTSVASKFAVIYTNLHICIRVYLIV